MQIPLTDSRVHPITLVLENQPFFDPSGRLLLHKLGLSLQQAYNAIAVSRQMKLLALNSSQRAASTSRENSCERKDEEVRSLKSAKERTLIFLYNFQVNGKR